jgi:hypothetical protein
MRRGESRTARRYAPAVAGALVSVTLTGCGSASPGPVRPGTTSPPALTTSAGSPATTVAPVRSPREVLAEVAAEYRDGASMRATGTLTADGVRRSRVVALVDSKGDGWLEAHFFDRGADLVSVTNTIDGDDYISRWDVTAPAGRPWLRIPHRRYPRGIRDDATTYRALIWPGFWAERLERSGTGVSRGVGYTTFGGQAIELRGTLPDARKAARRSVGSRLAPRVRSAQVTLWVSSLNLVAKQRIVLRDARRRTVAVLAGHYEETGPGGVVDLEPLPRSRVRELPGRAGSEPA